MLELSANTAVPDDLFTVEITTRCTNRCLHCFADRSTTKTDLPAGVFTEAVDEAFELGFRSLHLTGGEPLLRKDLGNLVESAFSGGYKTVYLNTNAQLCDKQHAYALSEFAEKIAVSVTVQGDRANHDYFRGSYEKAIIGIRHLFNRGLITDIFMPVGSMLSDTLAQTIDSLFRELPDIRSLFLIQMIRVPGDTRDLSRHLLSPKQFVRMCASAAGFSFAGLPVMVLDNPLANIVTGIIGLSLPKSQTLMRQGRITLLADTNLALAHSAHHLVGPYTRGALRKIIESDYYRQLGTASQKDHHLCEGCPHQELCAAAGVFAPPEYYRSYENDFCKRVIEEALQFQQ